ncbi:MAG: aspartate aminotransferase family protein [Gammaproteobacteria bacterium]
MSSRNLDLWDEYGDYLIPVQPFMDNVITKSEGSYLIDADGNRLLDLASGQFCTVLGHNPPEFIEALVQELRNNLHTGSQYVTEKVMLAAKMVAEVAPGDLSCVIFLSTGSEANEFALRVAKSYTNRSGAMGYDRGYYGISLGTRSLSVISADHVDFSPKIPETFHLIAPSYGRPSHKLSDLDCLELSIRLIGQHAENIAAVVVEPIISAGGMIYPTPQYMQAVAAYARGIGALLIVDESQTGFGRCGKWFDCENLGIAPDILVFSKTSGNGYPSAGVVISPKIRERLLDRGFYHLSSHQNDPVTATAVSAVIRTIRRDNLVVRSADMGGYFLNRLRELEDRHAHLWGARGRGLMIAFEIVEDKDNLAPWQEMLTPFVLACKARGVHVTYTYYEGAVRVIPASSISTDEIEFAIGVFDKVLADLAAGKIRPDEGEQQNKTIRNMLKRNKLKQRLYRMWETSPRYWVQKLRNGPR